MTEVFVEQPLDLPGSAKRFLCLHSTKRYGLLRGPTSSFGLLPPAEAFFAIQAKRELIMMFWPILLHFQCSVVTLVFFGSNLRTLKRINKRKRKKKLKLIQEKPKN